MNAMADHMPSAIERLVAEHGGGVLRVCRSILRDEHLGADAAQETFLRAWTHLADGRLPERLPAWLRRVAVSTSLDLLRRGRAREDAALRFAGAPDELAAREARARNPVRDAEHAELRERFEDALARLSEGQRTVFLMRHEGGLTLREVAEALEVSLPTVKTQFARACLKLQSGLAAFSPAPAPGHDEPASPTDTDDSTDSTDSTWP